MQQSYEKFRGVRFFGSLDGLRALSIVAVIWLHCWYETPYYPRLAAVPVLRQGFYGVQVFFVVSGFLITTLLLREKERYGKISLRDFYIRRAAYLAALLCGAGDLRGERAVFRARYGAGRELYTLPSKLCDVHIYLVHFGKLARGNVQPGMDALDGGTVLFFLAGRAAVFARGLVLGASDGNNRAETGDGPSPYRTSAAAGLAADANRDEYSNSDLPGRAAGAGAAPGAWVPTALFCAGMEMVGPGDAGSDASVPGAGTSAMADGVSGNDGADRSVRGARRQWPGVVPPAEAGGIRWDGELWDVLAQ